MNQLPGEVLDAISAFLNPTERWRLSVTNQRCRNLLPVPLRVKIVSHHAASALAPKFYVTHVATIVRQDENNHNSANEPSNKNSDFTRNDGKRRRRSPEPKVARSTTDASLVEGFTLKEGEELQLGMDYLFWTFDYENEQKVYLGRHGQNILYNNLRHNHGILNDDDPPSVQEEVDNEGFNADDDDTDESMIENEEAVVDDNDDSQSRPNCLYTLGLQARIPNQTWRLVKGVSVSASSTGETVVGLSVGGTTQNLSFRPDSNQRMFLSAQPAREREEDTDCIDREKDEQSLWYCLREGGTTGVAGQGTSSIRLQEEDCMSVIPCGNHYERYLSNRQSIVANSKPLSQRKLLVHAAPDVMDHGYYLYSPGSLLRAPAMVEVYHAKLEFHFWIKRGYMFFKIVSEQLVGNLVKDIDQDGSIFSPVHHLDFTFAVPILKEDDMNHTQVDGELSRSREPCLPLKILMERNSSRWWSIKHFMSNAADAKEGRPFVMTEFLAKVKDHDDHTIVYDTAAKLVYIDVKNAAVDTQFPDLSRSIVPWQFLLCG